MELNQEEKITHPSFDFVKHRSMEISIQLIYEYITNQPFQRLWKED
jgi:hypothetical protein